MEIKNVKLNHFPEIKAGTEKGSNGQPLAIMAQPEVFSFAITLENGSELSVPNEPTNRHYQDVKAWYTEQEAKPFQFDFKE